MTREEQQQQQQQRSGGEGERRCRRSSRMLRLSHHCIGVLLILPMAVVSLSPFGIGNGGSIHIPWRNVFQGGIGRNAGTCTASDLFLKDERNSIINRRSLHNVEYKTNFEKVCNSNSNKKAVGKGRGAEGGGAGARGGSSLPAVACINEKQIKEDEGSSGSSMRLFQWCSSKLLGGEDRGASSSGVLAAAKGGGGVANMAATIMHAPRRGILAGLPSPPTSFRFPQLRLELPVLHVNKTMTFWGNMLAGAISRSCAQTAMHPANVIKTLLQTKGSNELNNLNLRILTRGAGAQFTLSLPHGALAFAILEYTKATLSSLFPVRFAGPAFDFVSSAVSTTICSVISTPQMVLTDRIMAGYYPNLVVGVRTILTRDGPAGLYSGWFAALAQKIPSYGLTWVFFQQLKIARNKLMDHEATNAENFAMGALAAAATVCVMIPLDTIKTRIVTQAANPAAGVHYKSISDCFMRVLREEGIGTFYAPLAPRLASVVPMIGIQFGVYEFMKKMIGRLPEKPVLQPLGATRRREDTLPPLMSEVLDEIEADT